MTTATSIAGDTGGSLGGPQQGEYDAWVAKYSAAGALRWERQLGTAGGDAAQGTATDDDGNVYIAGYTDGALGGPFQGGYDAWVAKYSDAGALRWKRQLRNGGVGRRCWRGDRWRRQRLHSRIN